VCDEIGFIQIVKQTGSFSGIGAWLYNRDWHIDFGVPYPYQDTATGAPPHVTDPTIDPFSISMMDGPGTLKDGLGGKVERLGQYFETCVVCLRGGRDRPRIKTIPFHGARGVTQSLEKLVVYGCITWQHEFELKGGKYSEKRAITNVDVGPSTTFQKIMEESWRIFRTYGAFRL